MAIVFDGPVTPDALTTFVREVPTPADQVLNRLLPDKYFNEQHDRLRRADPHQPDRPVPGLRRPAARVQAGHERHQAGQAAAAVHLDQHGRAGAPAARVRPHQRHQPGAIVDAIYDDATNLTREVQARMEQARGDVLVDGKFTLTGEGGLFMEADYGVPAKPRRPRHPVVQHRPRRPSSPTCAPGSTRTSPPTGSAPGGMVVSRRILNYMLQNAELRTWRPRSRAPAD
jgi:hypothetical protein